MSEPRYSNMQLASRGVLRVLKGANHFHKADMMPYHRRWQFDRDSLNNVDIYTDRHTASETLSQAITSALSEEPDTDGSVQFGQMQGTVVGIRYYTGEVNPGEMVALVREPQNPYDRNAVMVANTYGSQVGHIKRELAAAMAYVMDNNLAKIEGLVHKGKTNAFNMPVMLTFWGKEEHKDAVIERMARHGFRLNLPGTKPTGHTLMMTSRDARGGRAPPRVIIPLSAEELKNAFDNLFEGLMESKDGEKDAAESVCTPLLAHQKQALSWMCACENSTGLPPFWSMKGELYYNSITCFNTRERPQRVRGGILADDMGLGKTLTTIALILTNFHKGKPLPLEKCEAQSASLQKVHKPNGGSDKQDNTEVKEAAAGSVCADHASSQDDVVLVDSSEVADVVFVDASEVVDVVFVDASEVVEESSKPQKKKKKGKATKPKARKEAPALHEDVEFLQVLSGLTSDGCSKTKTAAKRPAPNSGVQSSTIDTEEDLSARATLIICPLSVISNWLDQFEQHVAPDVKLNVYLYYGSDRNRNKTFLSSQDIVLTTYNVLSADFGNNSPLHGISWLRVVLDEGHVIRNPNAQMSKAVLALKAHRRWILSGTPIQNSVKDMWMLLAFLRLKPFDVKEWWDRVIQRPVTQGNRDGLKNLQTLVKCITLRRTKSSTVNGHPLVSLPEKTVCVEQVEMTPQERSEYEMARNEGKTTINRYVAEGTMMRNYADVLAILMRLRQHCCHPALVAKILKELSSSATPSELRERLIQKLRLVLASGCDEECSVCLDSVHLPVITHCAHVYCRACIARVISAEQDRARCPLCRSDIKTSQLVEVPPEELEEKDEMQSEKWRTSSKVDALMANLLRLRNEDCTIKCLVVSQFTRFLNILEIPLREQGFSFVRLDGSMTQKKRAQVIQDFQNPAPDSPVIMLLSLKAGGVGLNLTAASHVFMMDPAWNPAAEEQCIDRCHRLGQKRKVVVTKFIVKDSVEEKMVQIQRQKQDLVEKAFGKKNAERKTSHIDDIRALMDM